MNESCTTTTLSGGMRGGLWALQMVAETPADEGAGLDKTWAPVKLNTTFYSDLHVKSVFKQWWRQQQQQPNSNKIINVVLKGKLAKKKKKQLQKLLKHQHSDYKAAVFFPHNSQKVGWFFRLFVLIVLCQTKRPKGLFQSSLIRSPFCPLLFVEMKVGTKVL